MRVPVSPFATAVPEAVDFSGWRLATDDGLADLPSALEKWGYQTVLVFHADLTIDRRSVLESCGLGEDTELAVVVRARSDGTGISRAVYRLTVPLATRSSTTAEFDLVGREIAGRLTLETLLLATDPRPVTPVAASIPGSVLWSHRQKTDLQGSGSQFPTDAIDFSVWGRRNPDAAWELQVDLSEPEALFMSSVRLTLNTARPDVVRLLEGDRGEKSQVLRRVLHWDVTRQLVDHALGSDEVCGLEFDGEARTVTGVLRNLLSIVWPDASIATIQGWRTNDPSRIETHLQQHCRLVP
jgi:hypothetical protein